MHDQDKRLIGFLVMMHRATEHQPYYIHQRSNVCKDQDKGKRLTGFLVMMHRATKCQDTAAD